MPQNKGDVQVKLWEKKNLAICPATYLVAILSLAAIVASRAVAEPITGPAGLPENLPKEYRDIGVTEHRGDQLPMDLVFFDEHGQQVRLGQYFQNKRPVILQLGYLDCPMLCDVVSRGVIDSVKAVDLKARTVFDFVFVSINPVETPDQAALKKEHYVQEYAKENEAGGFHFLTGDEIQIHRLAASVGYRYNWIPAVKQFAHPSVVMVLTPDGHLSRYLYGVTFPERTMRLSLVEASNGKIGSAMDQVLIFCLHYDAVTGKYAVVAYRLMQIVCAFTAIFVGGTMFWFFRRESIHRASAGEATDENESGAGGDGGGGEDDGGAAPMNG
jgi:protein SCO1/2